MRRRGREGDRGAAIVELAIVAPVMLVIAFGLIGLGLAFKSASVMVSASRAGARTASASYAPAADDAAQLDAVLDSFRVSVERNLDGLPGQAEPQTLWMYRADAAGNPTGGASCASDCIRWTWSPASGHFVDPPVGTWASPLACGTTVDFVGVRVTARHEIGNPVLDGVDITRSTVMRLEPISDASC